MLQFSINRVEAGELEYFIIFEVMKKPECSFYDDARNAMIKKPGRPLSLSRILAVLGEAQTSLIGVPLVQGVVIGSGDIRYVRLGVHGPCNQVAASWQEARVETHSNGSRGTLLVCSRFLS